MPLIHAIYRPISRMAPGITKCGQFYHIVSNATTDPDKVTCKRCLCWPTDTPRKAKKHSGDSQDKQLDQHIGAKVALFRKELQLSRGEFGREVGFSQSWVSSLERGHENFDVTLLILCADALDRPVDDLLPPRRKGKMIFLWNR